MTPESAIDALAANGDPARAAQMAGYHKVARRYLGLSNAVTGDLATRWRRELDLPARIALADGLWQSDIFEARVAAAKLLTQARIRPDDAVWALICGWTADFDSWAIADHACMAGHRRVMADPARLTTVEGWTVSDHMWTRRAALVITLPWVRIKHPKPDQIAERERIIGWAAGYTHEKDWFIQKAIAWWIRDLSRHDPARSAAFLEEHGARMRPFARREAARHLPVS